MNILGYLIYLCTTFFITVYVGLVLYRNGEVFLSSLFQAPPFEIAHYNKFLLTGYYLLNLGYAAIALNLWHPVNSLPGLIEELGRTIGIIVITLGIMHFINMLVFYLITRQPKHSNQPQNKQS